MFTKGADRLPPLGFGKYMTISFCEKDDGKRRSSLSFCIVQLNVARSEGDVHVLNDLMTGALKESCGFGKI